MEALCENCNLWIHNGGPLNVGYCRHNKMAYRKASQTCDDFIRIVATAQLSINQRRSFIGVRHRKEGWSFVTALNADSHLVIPLYSPWCYDTYEAAITASVKSIMSSIGNFSAEEATGLRMLCDTALTPTLF